MAVNLNEMLERPSHPSHPSHLRAALVVCALAMASSSASAIPRFAARNGMECIQCHVNPSGGGVRNEYGNRVFGEAILPMAPAPTLDSLLAGTPLQAPAERVTPALDAFLVGGDLRGAYLWVRPDTNPIAPAKDPEVTSSFFLMQADLYIGVRFDEHFSLVFDLGAYDGFEAWALYSVSPEDPSLNFLVKAGRFIPPFGIRDVNHDLYTRASIGLGPQDRDTGVELTALLGPVSAQLAVTNGTLGEAAFDTFGSDRALFEKAIYGRAAARGTFGPLRMQLGLSASYNDNQATTNPLFGRSLPPDAAVDAAVGVNEARADVFGTVSLGRFTYMTDWVWVNDSFVTGDIRQITGFVSMQELSFVPVRGVELMASWEFMEPDIEVLGNASDRLGLAVEAFPLPHLELRAMARRTTPRDQPDLAVTDVVCFLHTYF